MDRSIFDHCHFQTCDFGKSSLVNAEFHTCHGGHITFYRAEIEGSTFKHCNFAHLNLKKCKLNGVDFSDSALAEKLTNKGNAVMRSAEIQDFVE